MKKLLPLFILLVSFACTSKNSVPNILLHPKVLSIDATAQRLFVADAEDNNLSLIDLTTHKIVTEKTLLNKDSAIRIPALPTDLAAVSMGNGVTRLFLIGNGTAPRNQIVVLDYNSTNGLSVAGFSPIKVEAGAGLDDEDILGGLVFDETTQLLFVSNTSDDLVRAYSITDGTEVAGSPLAVNSGPIQISLDPASRRLFVSSSEGNLISILQPDDLTIPATSFDVGLTTTSVAGATNATGTALFALSSQNNEIRVFHLNLSDLTVITPIGNPITAPAIGASVDATNVLTGAGAQITAAPLATGGIAGVLTQSTGDLGYIDVSADLTALLTGNITVLNGQNALDLDILKDASGNVTQVYFAAPGGSAVSYVDPTTHLYVGQVL